MRFLKRKIHDIWRAMWGRFTTFLEEHTLITFLIILGVVVSLTAFVFQFIEDHDSHPVWRAVVYVISGMDYDAPQTPAGQIAAAIVLLTGVVIVSLFTGYVAAGFSKLLLSSQNVPLSSPRRKFEDHIVIFGWSAKTKAILRELSDVYRGLRHSARDIVVVSALESLEKGPESIYKTVWHVRGQATDVDVLRSAGISSTNGRGARAAVVLSDPRLPPEDADRSSLLTVLAVEHLRPETISLAEVQRDDNQRHFNNANIDEVITPNQYGNFLLARSMEFPGLASYIDELLALTDDEDDLTRTPHGEPVSFFVRTAESVGVSRRSLVDAISDYYSRTGALIAGRIQAGDVKLIPDLLGEKHQILEPHDNLIVIGRSRNI